MTAVVLRVMFRKNERSVVIADWKSKEGRSKRDGFGRWYPARELCAVHEGPSKERRRLVDTSIRPPRALARSKRHETDDEQTKKSLKTTYSTSLWTKASITNSVKIV